MTMTDNSWQALEEKVVMLIAENERLRKENTTMKHEREQHTKRLYDLIALVDSASSFDNAVANAAIASQQKPILIQG